MTESINYFLDFRKDLKAVDNSSFPSSLAVDHAGTLGTLRSESIGTLGTY